MPTAHVAAVCGGGWMNEDVQGKVCPGEDSGSWESVAEIENFREMDEMNSLFRAGSMCQQLLWPLGEQQGSVPVWKCTRRPLRVYPKSGQNWLG